MFKKELDNNETQTIIENEFTDLSALVHAPIESIVKSNIEVNQKIIDAIEAMGKVQPIEGGPKRIVLDYLGIQYNHVKDKGGQESLEKMLLQVPVLSLVPLNGMKIKNAVIDFNAEVRAVYKENQSISFEGRICSPEVRPSDNIPKVHFKIELENEQITEGLARLQDIMDVQQITKKLETSPLTKTGQIVTGEHREEIMQARTLLKDYNKVKQIGQKLDDFIQNQVNYFNSLLETNKELNVKDYEEFKVVSLQEDANCSKEQTDSLMVLIKLDQRIKQAKNKRQLCLSKEHDLLEELLINDTENILGE